MVNYGQVALAVVAVAAVGWFVKAEVVPTSSSVSSSSATAVITEISVPQSAENNLINNISAVEDNQKALTVDTEKTLADTVACNENCSDTIDSILFPFDLTDAEFEEALVDVDALAARLRTDSHLRSELIDVAVYTHANKRNVIIAAFALLDHENRVRLGMALSASPYTQQRLDGVQLLGSADNMNKQLVSTFSEVLLLEQNEYVRSSAVKALNQTELFYGDQEVLDLLSAVIYSETNEGVRGEALLASANLTEFPEEMVHHTVDAIRTGGAEYKAFGARALDDIILRQTENGDQVSFQTDSELRGLVDEIMNPEYDDMSADTRKTLDDLVDRLL